MKWLTLAALSCVLVLNDGCAAAPKVQHDWGNPIVNTRLRVLRQEVQDCIRQVSIRDDNEHYEINDKKLGYPAGGHCHSNGTICMRSFTFSLKKDAQLWHEAGHAYHFHLDRLESDFSENWDKVSGGVLTKYGQKDNFEDVAEWMQEFHAAVNGEASVFDDLRANALALYGNYDPKSYVRKFRLLCQYGFFKDEDCKKFLARNPFE